MIGRRSVPSTEGVDKPKGFDDFELRLGDLMRGERATMGKSLLDVQRELKIKATYIAAIENCDIAAFETPGFIAGYVRSYARYLGMEADAAFAQFCVEANFTVAHGMSAAASSPRVLAAKQRKAAEYSDPLANPNATFVPRGEALFARVEPGAVGSLLVLVLLIGVIGYGGWSVLREVQQVQLTPVDQAPGVVAELDPLSGAEAVITHDGGKIAAVEPAPGAEALNRLYRPRTQALDVPVMVARDGPIAAIDPRNGAATPAAIASGVDATLAALATEPAAAGDTAVQVVADAAPGVEIFAVRPAWVRVQAADGTVLFEKILDPGERYAVPQTEAPALLRAGNSGSVYFAVNGQTYGPSAPGASVAKNVVLSPVSLTGTYALADLTTDPDLAKFVAVASADPTAADPTPAAPAP